MTLSPTVVDNYINGGFVPPSTNEYLDVINPANSKTIGKVGLSEKCDVDNAVAAAKKAFPAWSSKTIKQRAAIMMKFHALVKEHAQQMAELIVQENGKNITEALADVAKGNETVEWACGLPQSSVGNNLRVSGQVSLHPLHHPTCFFQVYFLLHSFHSFRQDQQQHSRRRQEM